MTTTSLEVQEERCRRKISEMDPSPASIEVIKDHGRPGGRGRKRPGRDRLLAMLSASQVEAIMAYKASRIGRDIEESEHLWNQCADNGAFIATVDCGDLSNAVLRGALFGMATQELEDRREYAEAIIDRRREQGLPPIKTGVAFGLRWVGERLEIHRDEWPTVEQIFDWFDAGITINEIARRLSRMRAQRRGAGHTQWSASAVSQKLRSTWYDGLVPDGSGGFWDAGRSFIDRELWERVQARLAERKHTAQNLDHVLSGLLFCGICEGWSPMSVMYSRHRRKGGEFIYTHRYRCIHHVNSQDFCPGQSIGAPFVERFLLGQLRAVIGGDELTQARFARRQRIEAERAAEGAADFEAEIAQLEKEEDALYERFDAGLMPERIYKRELDRSETQLAALRQRREQAIQRASLSRTALRKLERDLLGSGPLSDERWESLSPARRREFLALLFPHGIFVDPPGPDTRRGTVAGRLRVRDAAAAEAAQKLRKGDRRTGPPRTAAAIARPSRRASALSGAAPPLRDAAAEPARSDTRE